MFAVITVALITGAVVERIKFSALMLFSIIWFTIVYCRWRTGSGGGGWLNKLGCAGFRRRDGCAHRSRSFGPISGIMLGPRKVSKRKNRWNRAISRWWRWAPVSCGSAGSVLMPAAHCPPAVWLPALSWQQTFLAATAALVWMILSWIYRRPSLLGVVTGAVAGLVAITPAAGFIQPIMAIPIGAGVALYAIT